MDGRAGSRILLVLPLFSLAFDNGISIVFYAVRRSSFCSPCIIVFNCCRDWHIASSLLSWHQILTCSFFSRNQASNSDFLGPTSDNLMYFLSYLWQGHLLVLENFKSLHLNHGLMEAGYVNHESAILKSTKEPEAGHDANTASISMTATMDMSGSLVLGMSATSIFSYSFLQVIIPNSSNRRDSYTIDWYESLLLHSRCIKFRFFASLVVFTVLVLGKLEYGCKVKS